MKYFLAFVCIWCCMACTHNNNASETNTESLENNCPTCKEVVVGISSTKIKPDVYAQYPGGTEGLNKYIAGAICLLYRETKKFVVWLI